MVIDINFTIPVCWKNVPLFSVKLSIIIPLYNEEQHVVDTIRKVHAVPFPSFIESSEIIVVDDASTDNSYATVEALKATIPNLKLFKQEKNRGKGAAVRRGVKEAAGDVILFQDADLELSPDDIPEMLKAMQKLDIPFINGSRYMPGVIRTQAAFKRYFGNKVFTLMTSVFANVYLTDMACGYKLITKDLFEKLNLKENRFGFEAELIIKCARLRKNWIAEVPVQYYPRNLGEGKKLKNIDGLRIFSTIIKYGLLKMK